MQDIWSDHLLNSLYTAYAYMWRYVEFIFTCGFDTQVHLITDILRLLFNFFIFAYFGYFLQQSILCSVAINDRYNEGKAGVGSLRKNLSFFSDVEPYSLNWNISHLLLQLPTMHV